MKFKNFLKNREDGEYSLHIVGIRENEGVVRAAVNCVNIPCYITDKVIFYDKTQFKNKYVDIPLNDLARNWLGEMSSKMPFLMYVTNNGKEIKYKRWFASRREERRMARAERMAQLLVEEAGSVDGFFDKHNLSFGPDSPQEQIYREVKQGQIDFFKGIERKLR